MTRLPERTAGFAAALAVLAASVDVLLGQRTGLLVCSALLPCLFLALAVSILVFVRLRLLRLAGEEKQDQALARTETADAALFATTGEADAFTIARSREQFEKYFVPAAPLLLALAQAFWAWRLWRGLPWLLTQPRDPLVACAFLAGQAFFFFLLSRYQIGLSRSPDFRLLRGSAIASGVVAFGSLAGSISSAVTFVAWPTADAWAARAVIIVLFLLAAESAARFIAALYSPRRGNAFSTAYESRLATGLADPTAWTRNVAQALDYQFGFDVSQTGFFRLLQRALVPLVIFQLLVLYIMSCFVFLGPDEEAVLERFGKPVAKGWHLDSGLHVKRPWPFETVRRFPAKRILTTHIGYQREPGDTPPAVLIWTIPHFRSEDNFIVPSRSAGAGARDAVPVNLITMNIPIEYRITNIYAYAYGFADPENLLRQIAYRALTREIAGLDIFALLGAERQAAGERLKVDIQKDCDEMGLGVQIAFVALQGVHPPVAVADAFESVVGASEEREATVLTAKAYANSVMPVAQANSEKAAREAEAYRTQRKLIAAADAGQFEKRLEAYRKSPAVFKSRFYLGSLRDALVNARKYIVDAPPSRGVIYLNMEEKPYPDLFDLGPAMEGGEEK